MRALTSATGKVLHIDGRERPYTRDGKTYVTPADGPLCNSMGAARGNVRWYTRNAKVATCKSCLRALDAAHAEALAMNEVESAAARERTRIAAQRAEFEQAAAEQAVADKVAASEVNAAREALRGSSLAWALTCFKDDGRLSYRLAGQSKGALQRRGLAVLTSDGYMLTELGLRVRQVVIMKVPESEAPAELHGTTEMGNRRGMSVLLARGVTGFVEAGQRLRRADTGERGTVDAVGPNAVDMTMDDETRWSGASWVWERDTAELESPAEAAVARPLTFEDFPRASRVVRKSDGVQGLVESRYSDGKLAVVMDDTGTVSTGHWSTFAPVALGEDRELELLVAEVEANILDGALRRFAVDPVRFDATPSEAAALAQRVADTATRLAGPSPDAADVRALMGDVKRLSRWLAMSEPVRLLSYRSPYDAEPTMVGRRAAQAPLCRHPSRRWTKYGATCNTPLSEDGTCLESHDHV